MANQSPIFSGLSYPTTQLFGLRGSFVFFGLLIVLGGVTLLKPKYYSKALFKFAGVILLLVCGIFNFEILEHGLKSVNNGLVDMILQDGWWLGYIVLRWINRLFGGQAGAIKIFLTVILVAVIIAMAIYYRLKIPTFRIDLVKERYESVKESAKSVSNSVKSSPRPAKAAIDEYEDDEKPNSKKTETSALKSLIKDNLKKHVQKKEDDAAVKQLYINFPKDKPSFDLNLLDIDSNADSTIDESRLVDKAQAIKDKLQEFDIDVDIEGFNIGPTVLQIKIQPQAGIKISKIENLKKDISLAVKSKSLRVLAPIPGTDSVGIEIPNPKPQTVRLREMLGDINFTRSMSDNLTNLTIGKGIDGVNHSKSLEEMPHLLIAWATGSGKSVSINDYILSLIYQNSPSELKLIMVDPKQVELGMYEWIPYLLAPIITEATKAVKVLKWAVNFMESRYDLLKAQKVRNFHEYNSKVKDPEKMYRLVIIIDELADLMMSGNKKDTENYITRIAQKARAVGIHLILATQRPSVNVITGLIKANVPTRIAHGVVSQVDSRTILDMMGAEDLLGKGDLLYMDTKTKFPVRMQAPFISTAETEAVVEAIKDKYMSNLSEADIYHPEIMRILENKGEMWGGGDVSDSDEELLEQAIEIISRTRQASATMLQRKLWIGFPRAARLIDIMEERWVVGPQEWAKAREILI